MMRSHRHTWGAVALIAAPLLPLLGCKAGQRIFASPPQPMPGYQDEPMPDHTGGIAVLSGRPEHGAGLTTGGQGNPIAGGIATAVGLAVVSATTVKTIDACKQPFASASCLRGPSAIDYENDAGSP